MRVIFGGAFNPIHNEHVNIIRSLLSTEGVDKVILLPSNNPPHKHCATSFEDREEMIKIALGDCRDVEICDLESRDGDRHYTCEVLPKLKQMYGDIAFVIGGDSLIDLNKWKNPRDIIRQSPLIVFTRGEDVRFNEALKYWRQQGADIKVSDYHPADVSSTVIRYKAALGEFDDVDIRVAEYIKERGIYGFYAPLLTRLESDIPLCTFLHCLRTASFAIETNYSLSLGLDYDKVLLAGVLHDCAKALCHISHVSESVPKDAVGTPVEHQFLGAEIARSKYGVQDADVLEAIKYHTTGKKVMTDLQKLIFCSDMLERGRDYAEVGYLRKCMKKSLDFAYSECVKAQYEFLLSSKCGEIYPLTLETLDGINKK